VRDMNEVLRKKQSEYAQLGKQIEALQTAAEQLRTVAHLLNEEEEEKDHMAAGR
jgi:hypothetical protein